MSEELVAKVRLVKKGVNCGVKLNPKTRLNHTMTLAACTTYTNSVLCVCLFSVFACNLRADDLSSDMCLQGLAVQSLHGDREQCDREEALKDFKESM